MDFMFQHALKWLELGMIPDAAVRAGIRALCHKRLKQEGRYDAAQATLRYMQVLQDLKQSAIAIETDKANEQHYEVPTAFFLKALGARLKYSACYFPSEQTTLDEAEIHALKLNAERAQLHDGLEILELGCGWGSFSLWMAQQYPNARITGVSNSATQREYILAQAQEQGLNNLQIITQDVNLLSLPAGHYDRVVSVEMFEHVRNYDKLFANISQWLKPDGLLWCHIFCHRFLQYPFDIKSQYDWMSRYFFTGGLMPAASTFLHFQQHLQLQQHWQWSGTHYARTANAWLANMDAAKAELQPVFVETYGADAQIWWQRWRVFFMACAELFGLQDGQEWVIGHYLFNQADKTA